MLHSRGKHRFLQVLSLIISLALFISCNSPAVMPNASQRIHPFRLLPGEDLRGGIERYVDEHRIEAGYVITCVGSLTDWNLRFANQEGGATGSGHFEIVSLVGTVSTHGSHLHLSIADSTGQMTGGHLLEGNRIYTTAEIVLGESRKHRFLRKDDGSTGYEELSVENKE